MIKKTSVLVMALCLLMPILTPVTLQAQGSLTIIEDTVAANFPMSLSFRLSARSDSEINDIRLNYIIQRDSFTRVTSEAYVKFTPAKEVAVSWTLDMVKIGGLPPGSLIDYWWVLSDAAGTRLKTAESRVQFNDERYTWQSLTLAEITLHWYKGSESFVQELMYSAQEALSRLTADAGAELLRPVEIYIYASSEDLRDSMIFPQEWTGGVSFTHHGIIAIGIEEDQLDWGKGAIAHELSHLIIHQMTFNPYSGLPTWLDEGLAMYSEGILGPEFTSPLYQAAREDRLISVRSLSSPFSAYTETSLLSYAESFSVIKFLIMEYGEDRMRELLLTFREGSSYDAALKKVYGFDTEGLNDRWQEQLKRSLQTEQTGVWHWFGAVSQVVAKASDYLNGLAAQLPLLQALYKGGEVG